MKKFFISIIAVMLILTMVNAGAELTVLARYKHLFSDAVLDAARQAKLPDDLVGLTNLEKELFELGYAAGYTAGYEEALAPKVTYILNTSSMKFHYTDCSGVKNMSEKNKEEATCTRDELIEQGYTPCGTCKP